MRRMRLDIPQHRSTPSRTSFTHIALRHLHIDSPDLQCYYCPSDGDEYPTGDRTPVVDNCLLNVSRTAEAMSVHWETVAPLYCEGRILTEKGPTTRD